MVKNIIQEIKVQKGKHITSIPKEVLPVFPKHISSFPSIKKTREKKFNRYIIWFGIISLFSALVFYTSIWFLSAKISIISKTKQMELNAEQFIASKNENSLLGFEIMIVSDELKKDLIFTENKEVSLFAKGDIVLFNEFSTKSQKLSIHTRLSDNNGLIYLTDKAVTIPGYTLSKTKKVIAGSVTVSITAESAGDKYNGDPRDFSIVSFKNTTKYKKIYARSKTPLTGGALGTMHSLGAEQIGKLNAEAGSTFRVAMIKKLEAQVPSGYILYPNATTFSYTVEQEKLSPTPESFVLMNGTLSAIIFRKEDLSKTIIKQIFSDIPDGELKEIEIPKLNSFLFNFSNPNQQITKEMKEIPFTLTGLDTLIWHPNIELIRSDLLGINKKNFQSILSKYPGVRSGELKIFPPWDSYVPNDPTKITITVK